MNLVWTPALSVGVPAIDAQHAELFRRAAALAAAAQEGPGSAEVYRTLAFLGDYVVSHFSQEEQLMRDVGYPGLEPHAAEHAGFVARFLRFRAAFARGGADAALAASMQRELSSWLVEHVSGADRRIGEHIRAREADRRGDV
jgi:hemerythrin